MASVKFEKGSPEWQMFTEFWKLCQSYWEPENNDEYWKSLHDDSVAFGSKYQNKFAQELAIAFMGYQDKVLKQRKNNGESN